MSRLLFEQRKFVFFWYLLFVTSYADGRDKPGWQYLSWCFRNWKDQTENFQLCCLAKVALWRVTFLLCLLLLEIMTLIMVMSRHARWLDIRVVSVLDSGAEGPVFRSQPRRCRVTVLANCSHPLYLCSPSSKICNSPLKGRGGNCRPGKK